MGLHYGDNTVALSSCHSSWAGAILDPKALGEIVKEVVEARKGGEQTGIPLTQKFTT